MFKEISDRYRDYRDLLFILAWREFHTRYKHTAIGVLWAVLQPLSMMILLTVIFTVVSPTKVTSQPFPLFFYVGLTFWQFFKASLNYAIPCLRNNYTLITKVPFPKEFLPISGIIVAFIDMLISSFLLVCFMIFYEVQISFSIFWTFPLIFLLFIFTTGVSLIFSALNALYKDIRLASNFFIHLWFFLTPVMYSLEKTAPDVKALLYLNPMTYIIDNLKMCLLEGQDVIIWQYFAMMIFVSIFLLLSYNFFIFIERKFADVI